MVSIKNNDQIIDLSYNLIVYSYNIFSAVRSIGPIDDFNNCYLICTTYILDWALGPSFNLLKNYSICRKSIITAMDMEIDSIYMVNDESPLTTGKGWIVNCILKCETRSLYINPRYIYLINRIMHLNPIRNLSPGSGLDIT